MANQKIYHFESSSKPMHVVAREATVCYVGTQLAQLMCLDVYGNHYSKLDEEIKSWPINQTIGMTNIGQSDNYVVWVLYWLDMEYHFQPNVIRKLNEEKVRMHTTLSILLGPHNEMRNALEARGEKFFCSFLAQI